MLIANLTHRQGNMSSPDTNKDGFVMDPHNTISLLSIILLSLLILVIIIKGAVQVEVNRFMGEKLWMKKVRIQISTTFFDAIIVCRRSPAILGSAEEDFNMTKFVIKMTILCEIINQMTTFSVIF